MAELLSADIIPALESRDYPRFATALGEYNRLAGDAFRSEQGGCYSSTAIAQLVEIITRLGFPGVGQSSWGPMVFVITPEDSSAKTVIRDIQSQFKALQFVDVVSAQNHGATLSHTTD
jgi:predicted sugar kinase